MGPLPWCHVHLDLELGSVPTLPLHLDRWVYVLRSTNVLRCGSNISWRRISTQAESKLPSVSLTPRWVSLAGRFLLCFFSFVWENLIRRGVGVWNFKHEQGNQAHKTNETQQLRVFNQSNYCFQIQLLCLEWHKILQSNHAPDRKMGELLSSLCFSRSRLCGLLKWDDITSSIQNQLN